jgi:hypothetical protein
MTSIVAATENSPSMNSMRARPDHAMMIPIGKSNSFENVRTVRETLRPATGIAMADILFLTSSLNHLKRELFGSSAI